MHAYVWILIFVTHGTGLPLATNIQAYNNPDVCAYQAAKLNRLLAKQQKLNKLADPTYKPARSGYSCQEIPLNTEY